MGAATTPPRSLRHGLTEVSNPTPQPAAHAITRNDNPASWQGSRPPPKRGKCWRVSPELKLFEQQHPVHHQQPPFGLARRELGRSRGVIRTCSLMFVSSPREGVGATVEGVSEVRSVAKPGTDHERGYLAERWVEVRAMLGWSITRCVSNPCAPFTLRCSSPF